MLVDCMGYPLLTPDNYDKFLRNVEERIDSADREMKQRAENTLKVIAENYRRLLSDRRANELGMIDKSEATGNAPAAQHHRVLAEVYRSMLDSWQKVQAA
jgi:hypothetical protein